MTCECCAVAYGGIPRAVIWNERTYRAFVCDGCALAGHARQRCFLCLDGVWHCQRVAHVADKHPDWLEQIANDPDPWGLKAASEGGQRYIGKVEV